MVDWLGTGAVEQIWRPIWARGGYDLRQVVLRWLRSVSSCSGGGGLRLGASFAYTLIASWLSEFGTFSLKKWVKIWYSGMC